MLPIELRLLSRPRGLPSFRPKPTAVRAQRSFASSSHRHDTKPHSLESPTYPGLFYHSLPSPPHPPNSYSLSFVDTPPPSLEFSPSTIGILSAASEGSATEKKTGPPPLIPRNFSENADFKELLHEVLREAVKTDLGLDTMAKGRGEGFIHICDERNPADPNRVPDPSDIIASVLIQNAAVVPSSYEASRTHRIVTMDGMMQLNASLMVSLREALRKVREAEVEMFAKA